MMGLSTKAWVDYLVDDLGVHRPKNLVAQEVIARMEASYGSHLPLIGGAADAARKLGGRWRLGIASGSPRTLIEAVLEGAGIFSSIEAYVSGDEVMAGKPAPDVYIETARRLGVAPQDCIVVEDSTNGIKAGRAAGALVVAIPNRLFPPDPATLKTVDAVLPEIKNLTPEWLSQKGSFLST